MGNFIVRLDCPAHEMACEEILKQAPFLSRDIRDVRFSQDCTEMEFTAPDGRGEELAAQLRSLALQIQRSLRKVTRKVVFRSPRADAPTFADHLELTDVRCLGLGQVALSGLAQRLFRYLDRVFEAFGATWNAEPLITPSLIPAHVLARCDYFRSFPQYVTFAAHLREDASVIDDFRSRHEVSNNLDCAVLDDLEPVDTCLSPALCYHVYHLYENTTIPASGVVHGVCGRCFRFESSNLSDLRRLWDFTMREVVFLGTREQVLEARDCSMERMAGLLRDQHLAGEIRTASDPFFVAPDAAAKTYFQLSSESKFEVSLMLPGGQRLAAASHNYHSDFFGRAFHIEVEGVGPMHSACVGFGLERWVYAFLQQHGTDPSRWPDTVRRAREFANWGIQ
jgi:seryl-tRNA synthetase